MQLHYFVAAILSLYPFTSFLTFLARLSDSTGSTLLIMDLHPYLTAARSNASKIILGLEHLNHSPADFRSLSSS